MDQPRQGRPGRRAGTRRASGGEGAAGPAARLAALRGELARRQLDGFLVPRADEHLGEYVAPYAERLAWLTGFTGSAGLAVVLARRAALFVDGRYTLQAAAEVDPALFELGPLDEPPPEEWIAAHLPPGGRLGLARTIHEGRRESLHRVCWQGVGGSRLAGVATATSRSKPLQQRSQRA